MNYPLALHAQTEFRKTISAADVSRCAEIAGADAPLSLELPVGDHPPFDAPAAPCTLLVGLMSAAAHLLVRQSAQPTPGETPVTLGFDRIRFIKPVFVGDTVTVHYTVDDIDYAERRSWAKVEIFNAKEELVCIAAHILQWRPNAAAGAAEPAF